MINKYLPDMKNGSSEQFFLMAGPCAIEGEEIALRIAEKIVTITDKLNIPFLRDHTVRQTVRVWILLQVSVMRKHLKF